jgi:hypothetical protein
LELFAEQNLTQPLDNLSEDDTSGKLKKYFDQFNATSK